MAFSHKPSPKSIYQGVPIVPNTQFVGTIDKPAVRIEMVFGVVRVWHYDGTHSLLTTPETQAALKELDK